MVPIYAWSHKTQKDSRDSPLKLLAWLAFPNLSIKVIPDQASLHKTSQGWVITVQVQDYCKLSHLTA